MKMFPIFSCFSITNRRYADIKHFGECHERHLSICSHRSDHQHLLWSKFSSATSYSSGLTILPISILAIFCLCSVPKMTWPHAGAIITMVEDTRQLGNFFEVNNPTCLMTAEHTSKSFEVDTDLPVAGRHFTASPYPARSKFGPMRRNWSTFINSKPEPSLKLQGKTLSQQLRGCNFVVHDKFSLLCHAPGTDNARGHFS
jgi:hypothetical protein